jgi:hypothetical protein
MRYALGLAALVVLLSGADTALADSYTAQPTPLFYANDMESPAAVFPLGGPAMTKARAIADQTWGYDPCGGTVDVTWATAAPSVNATATWSNPTDAYAAPQQNTDCSVAFNDQQAYDWPMLCTVFVHEFGHLTGHQHSSDQTDVMFPYYTQPIAVCANTPNPQAAASPAPTARPARVAAATAKKGKAHRRHHRARRSRHHRRHRRIKSHSLAPGRARQRTRQSAPRDADDSHPAGASHRRSASACGGTH